MSDAKARYKRDMHHRLAMERIKREVQDLQERFARLRRQEEGLSAAVQDSQWATAKYRAALLNEPIPADVKGERLRQMIERDGMILPRRERAVRQYRAHSARLATELGVEVSWAARPATNAYAWAPLKRIECAPIVNDSSACVVWHELGHCARPCVSTHTRVQTAGGILKASVCVRCELLAWQWAIERGCAWTREMHDRLAKSLRTYSRYATPGEQREIEHLTSANGFRDAWLTHAQRSFSQ